MKTLFLLVVSVFAFAVTTSASAQELDKNYLGAQFLWVGHETVRELFKETKVPRLTSNFGIFVVSVRNDGPMKNFEPGDVLISIDGKFLREEEESISRLLNLEPGKHEIVVQRGEVSKAGRKSWKKETISMTAGTYRDYVMNSIVSSQDDFTKLEVLRHRSTPDSAFGPTTACFLLVKEGKEIEPAIRFQLRTDDWLFVRSVTLLIDGETIEFSQNECRVKREVVTGSLLHEWCTVTGTKVEKVMKNLGNAERIAVRFHGENLKKDHEFKERELHAANTTALAYRLMTEKK